MLILSPLLGVAMPPAVDLVGHLAVLRFVIEFCNGSYQELYTLNYWPIYKPTYVALYALAKVLPLRLVGVTFLSAVVLLYFASILITLRISLPAEQLRLRVIIFALATSTLVYNNAFAWGLIVYLSAVPFATIAYISWITWLFSRKSKHRTLAITTSLIAHLIHPIASLYLGLAVATSSTVFLLSSRFKGFLAITASGTLWAVLLLFLQQIGYPQATDTLLRLKGPLFSASTTIELLQTVPRKLIQIFIQPESILSQQFLWVSCGSITFGILAIGLHSLLTKPVTVEEQTCPPSGFLLVAAFSNLLLLFGLNLDAIRLPGAPGVLWHSTRGSAMLVMWAFILAGAAIMKHFSKHPTRVPVTSIFAMLILLSTSLRLFDLRKQFVDFDSQAKAYVEQQTPLDKNTNIRQSHHRQLIQYHCYLHGKCTPEFTPELFIHRHPQAALYPLRLIHPSPFHKRNRKRRLQKRSKTLQRNKM